MQNSNLRGEIRQSQLANKSWKEKSYRWMPELQALYSQFLSQFCSELGYLKGKALDEKYMVYYFSLLVKVSSFHLLKSGIYEEIEEKK